MTQEVFVVVVEDRHTDVDVWLFSELSLALIAVEDYLKDFKNVVELKDIGMVKDSFTLKVWTYGYEGDSVTIYKKVIETS